MEEDYSKDVGKYLIQIRYSFGDFRGPIVFSREYSSVHSISEIEEIAGEHLTRESKERDLEDGLVYKVFQNVLVVEKKEVASGSMHSIRVKKNNNS